MKFASCKFLPESTLTPYIAGPPESLSFLTGLGYQIISGKAELPESYREILEIRRSQRE